MRISKIKALCAEMGACDIFHMPGGQMMIGNGICCYDTEGMTVTEDEIPALFDLDKEKAEKWIFGTRDYSAGFAKEGEELKLSPLTAALRGDEYRLLEDSAGDVWMIPQKSAEACRGKAEYRKYWLDEIYGGFPTVRVTDGIDQFPAAYIAPMVEGGVRAMLNEMQRVAMLGNGAEDSRLAWEETRSVKDAEKEENCEETTERQMDMLEDE